jgi:hypothetical protein
VLDVRPITLGTLSVSEDETNARNAISFGDDDGLSFADEEPSVTRSVAVDLRYRVDRTLADGVLFAPGVMEHKWAIFHHAHRLLFVRSWQRRLVAAASTRVRGDYLEVTDVQGSFTDSEDETVELSGSILDFLIRAYALDEIYPAPLEADPGKDLKQAGMWCVGMFGNRAWVATHHRLAFQPPDAILRSDSLFHLAVGRGDYVTAQHQLDSGVPVDVLDRHGFNAMWWAPEAPPTEALAWLLDRGLDVDARSDEGATSLMIAVQQDDHQLATWLLQHGADPNATDNRGFTSLHRAAEMGHLELVRLLLEQGANPNSEAQGHTPLSLAQHRDQRDIADLLTDL